MSDCSRINGHMNAVLCAVQVYYNNALSLPLLCIVAAVTGEFSRVTAEPAIYVRGFQAAALLSAFCGFIISFCSLWFLSTTTATTFSLVGSLNKVLEHTLLAHPQALCLPQAIDLQRVMMHPRACADPHRDPGAVHVRLPLEPSAHSQHTGGLARRCGFHQGQAARQGEAARRRRCLTHLASINEPTDEPYL